MKIEKLSQHLRFKAEEYAEKAGALKLTSEFKDSEDRHKIELEKIILEFIYSKKERENCPVSTLYCRVYLDKESGFFFEIPEILAYINVLDFHCYYFPYIESIKRMDACFDYITDFIEYRKREILPLCERAEELKQLKLEEIKRVYGYDESLIPGDENGKKEFYGNLDEYVSSYTLSRFVSGKAHLAYLHGDYEASLKEYEKQGELLECEKRIVSFIDGKLEPYQAMPLECASLLDIEQYKKKNIKSLAFAMLAGAVGFFAILFIIQLIINIVYYNTTLFCACTNPIKTALLGVVPGIAAAVVFRSKFEALFFKNRKEAYEFSDLFDDKGKSKAAVIIVITLCALLLLTFADYSRPAFKLYKDRVEYNSHIKVLNKTTTYTYDEFRDVVYIEGKYSKNLEKYKKEPYYILEFVNNQYIDIDRLHLSKKREEKLIETIRGNRESSIRHETSIEEIEQ